MTRRVDRHDEGGFALIEVIVALALIAIVAVGFLGSVSLGFRTIAIARQRSIASEIATARLEHLRNVPYDYIALDSAPVYNPDASHPDHFVSLDGAEYDVSGKGDSETLIIATDGDVLQVEDPVDVGTTTMEIYQYVTWVDDPTITGAQDYKRVTVAVLYKTPAATGSQVFQRTATLFTDGTITIPAPTTTVASPSTTSGATTTTVATPASTVAPSCPGDVDPPAGSFEIGTSGASEDGFTATTNVSLHLSFTDACPPIYVKFSNDGATFSSDITYDDTNSQVSWSLSPGNGLKQVWVQARDAAGNVITLPEPEWITLDETAPSAPATVTFTASCAGSERTVVLSWSASTDAEGWLRGYRVYRSTNSDDWEELVPGVVGTTKTDVHSKNLVTVRYYVVAYDRAGNVSESAPVPEITLSKHTGTGC